MWLLCWVYLTKHYAAKKHGSPLYFLQQDSFCGVSFDLSAHQLVDIWVTSAFLLL